jgi:hypothetical protein
MRHYITQMLIIGGTTDAVLNWHRWGLPPLELWISCGGVTRSFWSKILTGYSGYVKSASSGATYSNIRFTGAFKHFFSYDTWNISWTPTNYWRFLCNSASTSNCQCSTLPGVFSKYRIYIFSREEGSLSCLRLTQVMCTGWPNLPKGSNHYRFGGGGTQIDSASE